MLLTFEHPTCYTDMDDTLYPMSSGLNLACRKNIEGMTVDSYHDDDIYGVSGGNTVTMIVKLSYFNCRLHVATFAYG